MAPLIPISGEKESRSKDIFKCSDESKPIEIRVATALSKFRYVKLQNLILKHASLLFDVISGVIYVRYIFCLNVIIF